MPSNATGALVIVTSMATTMAVAQTDAPLSAIDWLSDSVATPVALPDTTRVLPSDDVAISALPSPVATMPLDAPLPDALGLIDPDEIGLPHDLWGASPAADIATRLRGEPLEMLPAMQALLHDVLLARFDPPVDASEDTSLFLARIDRLLELGLLAEADALLSEAAADDPQIFRRTFDVALLTGRENAACAQMANSPDISPTYPARIFCLARRGDWQAAALTLESANALDILSADQDYLMARFLDPELFENEPLPRAARRPTPLVHRLYEAIGEPQSTTGLPIAFAHADLRPTAGWKTRLTAAERLAKTGAIDSETLFALYRERRPAASGGVWDRAAAIQSLDRALEGGLVEDISDALPPAWTAMQSAGLETPFAETYGARLAALSLTGSASGLAFRIGLLSPEFETVAENHRPQSSEERALIALARGLPSYRSSGAPLPLAVRDGMEMQGVPTRYRLLVTDDKRGEALLHAIRQFSEGAYGDYDQISDALGFFRFMGLDTVARHAALELLILERRG